MATITFEIDLKGNVTSSVEGAEGLSCDDLTKPYYDGLGDPDPDKEYTAEACEIQTQTQTQTLTH
jgi:hypothetical protein